MTTEPAVTENVVLTEPPGTVTVAGTGRTALLLERATATPPAGATCVSCAVQVDEAAGSSAAGVQLSDERAGVGGGRLTCTRPPVAVKEIAEPAGEAAIGCAMRIARDMLEELVLSVAFTTATTPSPSGVPLGPQSMHLTEPLEELQDIDLPAAVATGPAVTVRALKSTAV